MLVVSAFLVGSANNRSSVLGCSLEARSLTLKLWLARDPDADRLLVVLDRQIPLEVACNGPKKIADRIGGFDAAEMADYDPGIPIPRRRPVSTIGTGTSAAPITGPRVARATFLGAANYRGIFGTRIIHRPTRFLPAAPTCSPAGSVGVRGCTRSRRPSRGLVGTFAQDYQARSAQSAQGGATTNSRCSDGAGACGEGGQGGTGVGRREEGPHDNSVGAVPATLRCRPGARPRGGCCPDLTTG